MININGEGVNLVFCPKCGKKLENNPDNCDRCGEVLSEEKNFQRIFNVLNAIGIVLFIAVIILLFFFGESVRNNNTLFITFFILLGLAIFIFSSRAKRLVQRFVIRILFGGLKSRRCASCENMVSDEDYCFNCGYPLKNSLGYWKMKSEFVEVTQEYIRVFKTRITRDADYDDGDSWAWHRERLPPQNYKLENIKNPEVDWCTHLLFTSPCFRFDWRGSKINIPINQEILNSLNRVIPHITEPSEISGLGTWVKNQNKYRFSAVILIFLVLAVGLWAGFGPESQVPIDPSHITTSSEIPGLEFSNVTAVYDNPRSGYLTIEGYIKNKGNVSVKYTEINATGYNASGNIVRLIGYSDSTTSERTDIYTNKNEEKVIDEFQPGQLGYFKIILQVNSPNEIKSLNLSAQNVFSRLKR